MATQTFRVIRDENMDVRYGGTSFANATNTSKTKKTARVGLKPLSDITNSGIPSNIKVSRKKLGNKVNDEVHYLQNLNVGCEGACVARGSNVNESQKKTDRSGRRALVDISNSKKLSPKNALAAEKNNWPAGRRALADISNLKKVSSHQSKEHSKKLDNIAEECFLHNHQECIDSQRRGLDLQTFFTGLDDDFLVGLRTPPVLSKTKSKVDFASPPRYMDVPELLSEAELPPYERTDTIPSPCSSRYASPTFDLLKSP